MIVCLYFGLMVLTCLPRKEKLRGKQPIIICVGDSITFEMGVNWTRKRDCWTRRLEALLNGKLLQFTKNRMKKGGFQNGRK